MNYGKAQVGKVLELQRRPVEVDPTATYEQIGVRSFGKGLFHKDPVSGIDLGKKRVFRIEPGDLVLSNVFAWEGAIALASPDEEGKIGSHRFMTYRPVDDWIDASWAAWFFLSEPGLKLIQEASPGSAGRNRTLAIDRFEALEIPLPSIDEQRDIADRLDDVRGQVGHLLEQYERARKLATALPTSVCCLPHWDDSTKNRSGWHRVPLSDLIGLSRERVAVDPSSNYPNVGIYSFGRGLFAKPPIEGASTSAKTLNRIHAGQFIYSRLFAFEGAYAHVSPEFDGHFVSNEFPTFDTDSSRLNAEWLATALRSPDRWAQLAGSSKGLGMRRQRIPVEAVLSYEMWIPPIQEQQQMVHTVSQLNRAATDRTSQRQRIDALLPAALSETFSRLS